MSKTKKHPQGSPARTADGGRPGRTVSDSGRQGAGSRGRNAGRSGATKKTGKPRSAVRAWISGARLRTLPLSIAPVALGTGAAMVPTEDISKLRVLLCLLVAIFLQIGVNYANDYSDGVRGTDAFRVGPPRLTGSGAVRPRTVLIVALSFFALAAVSGLVLVVLTGYWWLLAVGAVAILAAWFYTGGKHPYGYYALGELFVFVFFGLVATAGTTFILAGEVNTEAWLGGIAIGALACAVLMANNIRDIEQDKLAKKRTLSVLIGRTASRVVYVVWIVIAYAVLAFLSLLYPKAPLVFFTLLLSAPATLIMLTAKTPREFILVLQLTSFFALAYGVGLGLALGY